jgi:chemotaxis-related protein WspB
MLMLLFQAGTQRYALDSQSIVEVIPWASLYPATGSHSAIAGLLNYHSQLVSVIDLGQLIHAIPSQPHYGTRIIIIRGESAQIPGFETAQWLGLLADRVVDTRQVTPAMLTPVGLGDSPAPYLGAAIVQDQSLIRCFQPAGIDLSIGTRSRARSIDSSHSDPSSAFATATPQA